MTISTLELVTLFGICDFAQENDPVLLEKLVESAEQFSEDQRVTMANKLEELGASIKIEEAHEELVNEFARLNRKVLGLN